MREYRASNQLQSFVRPFTESANSGERCFLYFITLLLINDISYEVVIEKQEVMDGMIGGRTRKEFNRKTRQQIVAVATKLLNIGNDDNDRLIAVPLPAGLTDQDLMYASSALDQNLEEIAAESQLNSLGVLLHS